MATATRRVMGVVLTALGLVLATTGLVTLVTPGLGQQPRAVAPIELQPPVGPAGPGTPATPDPGTDGPAVVAGAEEPAEGSAPQASSPSTPADPDAGSADQPRDQAGAVVVEAPAPVVAGAERDPATAQDAEDDVPTPAEEAPAPADGPGTDDGEDDGGSEADPNEVATRDDDPAPDDDDPDDDEDDEAPVAKGRRGGAERTPTRFTARAPSLDADHGGGPTIDVPGVARGLADGADHPGKAQGKQGHGAKGHGTPWTARGR